MNSAKRFLFEYSGGWVDIRELQRMDQTPEGIVSVWVSGRAQPVRLNQRESERFGKMLLEHNTRV